MICKRCKQEIPDDAAICKYCGEIIEENMEKKVKEKEQEIQKMEEDEKEDLSIEELLREPLPTEFKVTDKLPYKQSKQYLERKKQVKKTIAMAAGMLAATAAFGVGTFFLVRSVVLRPDDPIPLTRVEPETGSEAQSEDTVKTATPSVSAVSIKKETETETETETERETQTEKETQKESESVGSVTIQVASNRRDETEEVAPVTIKKERETETNPDPAQTQNPGETDPGQREPEETESQTETLWTEPQTEPETSWTEPQTEPSWEPETEPPWTEPPQTEPPQTEAQTDPYQEGWGEDEEPIYSGGGYILPNSSSELLTRDDLVGMSVSDLMLARNEIFARHGRMFEDEWLQSYFNSQSWYQPLYSPSEFSYDLLSSIEVQNVETILTYEEELAAQS